MALINQLNNLGDAVRERTATTDKLTLEQMAEVIKAIPYPEVEETTITENGVYEPTGDGFSKVTVEVPAEEPVLQFLDVTKNGEYYAPEGVHGFNPVFIDVPEVEANLGPITITENGTYKAPDYELDGFKKVFVEVPIPEPEEPTILTLEVDQNGEYYAPEGVHGYNPVIVDVPVEAALGPLTITENGIYKADAYDLDGFKKVRVEVPTGGGAEVEPIVLEGTQSYGCSGPLSGKYIELFGDTISTQYLGDISNMFAKNTATKIPFDLNCSNVTYYSFLGLFSGCQNLTELPNIHDAYPSNMSQMFNGCYNLREIPEGIDATWDWNRMHTYNYASVNGCIQQCYSLRKIPESFMKNLWSTQTSTYSSIYYSLCSNCYALDEIRGIPIMPVTYTSNAFNSFMAMCARVKDIIFDMNEDGTPKTANWKGQSIILYSGIGYMHYTETYLYNYNSGITADKQVTDDATYQALKNDPDWFSKSSAYSRYNHDSAVNTINSLPDTSAYLAANGGTNTISFSSGMGSATDGGAISNLTEEEIAIATAKGWTVTLV